MESEGVPPSSRTSLRSTPAPRGRVRAARASCSLIPLLATLALPLPACSYGETGCWASTREAGTAEYDLNGEHMWTENATWEADDGIVHVLMTDEAWGVPVGAWLTLYEDDDGNPVSGRVADKDFPLHVSLYPWGGAGAGHWLDYRAGTGGAGDMGNCPDSGDAWLHGLNRDDELYGCFAFVTYGCASGKFTATGGSFKAIHEDVLPDY